MTKPFAWSWSRLKNYRTCPKRHWHIDLNKDVKERESEQLKWGNVVHTAMAEYIEKGKDLPITVKRYHDWPDNVRKLMRAGVDVRVEQQLAIAKDFTATGYFDNPTWFRAKLDVLSVLPQFRGALTIDWKTGGKVEPEFEQLALSAQTVFAHHPDVDEVLAIYVWFGHDTQTAKVYKREDMVKLWNQLWPTINEMEEAWRTTTYPPRPSGLCKNYCPVTSCPYHGKGSY